MCRDLEIQRIQLLDKVREPHRTQIEFLQAVCLEDPVISFYNFPRSAIFSPPVENSYHLQYLPLLIRSHFTASVPLIGLKVTQFVVRAHFNVATRKTAANFESSFASRQEPPYTHDKEFHQNIF